MPANHRFRNVIRIGPVQVGTAYDHQGREKNTAACTAPRCGFRRRTGRPYPPLPRPLKGPTRP